MKFTHLHVHSHYSLLDGLSKIDDILDRCQELKMDSIALTDHGVMYGIIEFYEKAKQRGIKPILGVEAYQALESRFMKRPHIDSKRYHLILLAKNKTGYQNLIKLTTKAHLEGFYYKPRIDKELLRKYHNGIICMSACLQGEVPSLLLNKKFEQAKQVALEYQEIFGKGNYYLEIMDHPNLPNIMPETIQLSEATGIPLVATNDAHYCKPEHKQAQDILLCIQTNRTIDEKDRMTMMDGDYSIRTQEQMINSFQGIAPSAIENTQIIADQCNVELELGKIQLPHFSVPKPFTDHSYLSKLCRRGLKQRYKKVSKKVKQRLKYELAMIKKMGFPSYFLIVHDFVEWARKNGIVYNTRGSAAGCLVSYLLKITHIDPLKYNLLFERFLNPGRISMPDIDLDFADHRRDEVIEYVRKKYGKDKVAQIITFGTMAARMAIRDVGRALGYEYNYCDKIAKMIPMFSTLEKALSDVDEFKSVYQTDSKAKKLIDFAKQLEGIVRHASTHACGVLITKDRLDKFVPLQYSTQDNTSIVTQYEMHAVEDLGLLKMDFLGLKNLTVIEKTLEQIKKRHNRIIDFDKISMNDKKTFELFKKAKTTSVFQLESAGMRRYLKQLEPNRIEDIIAMVSLYRPGPMELIPEYIARKHNKKAISYIHPKLEPILKETYGLPIFQEQIMQIAQIMAGFSLSEADTLRKAIGKKIKELLDQQKVKFIQGCSKNKIPKSISEKLLSWIEPHARYSFNKSHATSYAIIAFRTAYLKAHYPAEFMSALLTADQGNTDRIGIEVNDCKQMGIDVLPPDINESKESFTVINDKTIRFGLEAIKNVGHNVVSMIAEHAPYKSLEDFAERVSAHYINKKSMEALIKCGAFDRFGERNRLLKNLSQILNYAHETQAAKNSGQSSLFGNLENAPQLYLENAEPASKQQYLAWEKELLGLYLSEHPVSEYEEFLNKHTILCADLDDSLIGSTIKIGGVINKVQRINTRNGQAMVFAIVEDKTGQIEVIVFPRILKQNPIIWQEGKIVLVTGRLNNRDGSIKIICNSAQEM